MRRVRLDDALGTVPANGYVEVFQDERNADNANDQFMALSLLSTATQGGLADTALQPADVGTAAAEDVGYFATAAQGALADTAVQPTDVLGVSLTPGSSFDTVGTYNSSIEKVGDLIKTTIYVDLTGLQSMTDIDDIIGAPKGADIVVNGDFAADSDWTYGVDWSFAANKADCAPGTGSRTVPAVDLVAVIGKTYELVYTMSSYSAGTCTASFGGQAFTPRSSDATFTERIVATTTESLMFDGDAAGDFQIDDISLKEVPLAHLGQFTVAQNGTLFDGEITWLETPATGVTDIDFWMAPEGSGAFSDAGKTDLTEVVVYAKGSAAAAARATPISLTALPAADNYLYMFAGVAGTTGTYTAGIFKLIFWGA